MSLRSTAGSTIRWIGRVVRQFFRVTSKWTVTVISSLLVARYCRWLANVLPLKVILLAGSPGIPSYFQPFLTQDQKLIAIALLATAAFGSYFLRLFLETFARRLSEKGGDALLAVSTGMTVVANQRSEMQSYFYRFTFLASDTLFVLVGLFLLLFLSPWLVVHLVSFALVALGFTVFALQPRPDHTRSRLAAFIQDKYSSYLNILSSLAFLSGFLVLLLPIIEWGTEGVAHATVLYAIIGVFLLRLMLGATSTSIKEMINLSRQRHLIDVFVFPERQMRKISAKDHMSVRELFRKPQRLEMFRSEFPDLVGQGDSLDVRWQVPMMPGTQTFLVSVQAEGGGPVRHYQLHAYPVKQNKNLDNEELLFRTVLREDLMAPRLVKRFLYGPFDCALYEAGLGEVPPPSSWKQLQSAYALCVSGFEPPKPLVEAFSTSHPHLGERLNDEIINRVELAIEDDGDAELFERFSGQLPDIRARLYEMPLSIANPDFRRATSTAVDDDRFNVMVWGRWKLEPLGFGLDLIGAEAAVEEILDHARKTRTDIPSSLRAKDVEWVNTVAKLERYITGSNYREGLSAMRLVIDGMTVPAAAEPRLLEAIAS